MDTNTIIALLALLATGVAMLAGTVAFVLGRIDAVHQRVNALREDVEAKYVRNEVFAHLDRAVTEIKTDVRAILTTVRSHSAHSAE